METSVSRIPKLTLMLSYAPSRKSAVGSPVLAPGKGDARRADEYLLELQAQHLVSELEAMLAADPAHGVLELKVTALESCRESGSKCEAVCDIDSYRARGHILRHVDPERLAGRSFPTAIDSMAYSESRM